MAVTEAIVGTGLHASVRELGIGGRGGSRGRHGDVRMSKRRSIVEIEQWLDAEIQAVQRERGLIQSTVQDMSTSLQVLDVRLETLQAVAARVAQTALDSDGNAALQ